MPAPFLIYLLLACLLRLLPADAEAGGVYWTDRGTSRLKRMAFDGTQVRDITLSGSITVPGTNIRGIAVDASRDLMFWADNIGVKEVYRQIEEWHQRYGARWKPSAFLKELADSGTSLREAKPKIAL